MQDSFNKLTFVSKWNNFNPPFPISLIILFVLSLMFSLAMWKAVNSALFTEPKSSTSAGIAGKFAVAEHAQSVQ